MDHVGAWVLRRGVGPQKRAEAVAVNDALNIAPGIEAEDAQALAKAIVTSMLADPDRMHPGDRTTGLLLSARDTALTLFMVADIAAATITLLLANGIDVRDQLVSPYLIHDGL